MQPNVQIPHHDNLVIAVIYHAGACADNFDLRIGGIMRLNMHNIEVPDDLNNERISVLNHKESMSKNSNNLKNIKFEPFACSSCILAAQIMTSDEKNAENIINHTKSYLNESQTIDFFTQKT